MPSLILLSGNIASGKTTLARNILKNYDNTVYISDDDIWTMLGCGDYGRGFEQLDENELHLLLAPLVGYLLKTGKNVVLDLPAFNEARREHFVYPEVQHLLIEMDWELPAEHAARRFKAGGRGKSFGQWLDVANEFQTLHQPVTDEEKKTWHTLTATEFNDRIINAVEPELWPTHSTPPSVGESSPSSPISSSISSSDPQHLDDNHPDAFGSPGEYASEEEWEAFRHRTSNSTT